MNVCELIARLEYLVEKHGSDIEVRARNSVGNYEYLEGDREIFVRYSEAKESENQEQEKKQITL